MPKFSIIVPVFNTEAYLETCVSSVVRQTVPDWELILVDDGSADSSGALIDRYAAADDRIIAIHQANAGPGEARNAGIARATGEFIVCLDSDDYADEEYLAILDPKTEDADLIFIDVERVTESGAHIRDEKMSVYSSLSKDQLLRSMMTGRIPWGGVRKVIRRSVITGNGIRYSSLSVGEEALFSFQTLYFAKRFTFAGEKSVYKYVERAGSQSKLGLDDPWGGAFEAIRDYTKQAGIYPEFAAALNAFNVSSTVVSMDRITRKYRGSERHRKLREREARYRSGWDRNYPVDRACLPLKAKLFIPFLNAGWYWTVAFASIIRQVY